MQKTILIPGANGKIGFQLTKYFLDKNFTIIAIDKQTNNLKKINNQSLSIIKSDLTSEKNIKKIFKTLEKKKIILNSMVYCLYPKNKKWGKNFNNLNVKDLKENLYYQIGLPIIFLKNLYSFLLKNKRSEVSLLMISSIQGIRAPKFDHYKNLNMVSPIEYSACKAGIISLTSYLTKFFKQNSNIRLNCISPGGILDNQNNKFLKRYKKDCISKGMLDPEDLCELVNFLLDEKKSRYIRGQNIIIDDGWSL